MKLLNKKGKQLNRLRDTLFWEFITFELLFFKYHGDLKKAFISYIYFKILGYLRNKKGQPLQSSSYPLSFGFMAFYPQPVTSQPVTPNPMAIDFIVSNYRPGIHERVPISYPADNVELRAYYAKKVLARTKSPFYKDDKFVFLNKRDDSLNLKLENIREEKSGCLVIKKGELVENYEFNTTQGIKVLHKGDTMCEQTWFKLKPNSFRYVTVNQGNSSSEEVKIFHRNIEHVRGWTPDEAIEHPYGFILSNTLDNAQLVSANNQGSRIDKIGSCNYAFKNFYLDEDGMLLELILNTLSY